MKKIIGFALIAIAATCAVSSAGVEVISEGTFFGSGTGADVVIQKQSGTISDENLFLSIASDATITIHRPRVSTTAGAASASTAVTINTDTSNTVSGVTITTDDYLVIAGQLRDITTLTPASATSTVVTIAASAAVYEGQKVYIADQADIVQFAGLTTHADPIPYVFTGFRDNPVAISVPSGAGATLVSGRYSIKR